MMGISLGINDDDIITIDDVSNHYEEDIERSMESSGRSRALEDSASIRSIPVDCPSVRRESNAADYHTENLPYYNTI